VQIVMLEAEHLEEAPMVSSSVPASGTRTKTLEMRASLVELQHVALTALMPSQTESAVKKLL